MAARQGTKSRFKGVVFQYKAWVARINFTNSFPPEVRAKYKRSYLVLPGARSEEQAAHRRDV